MKTYGGCSFIAGRSVHASSGKNWRIEKAAGILSTDSPFWTVSNRARYLQQSPDNSNLVELTREEWEARRRRKMFRLISA